MSQIIAGIYEIEEQIGAGGGGIVYLGRHLRLNKKVVLKADKRTLATESNLLRREVDMLKNLSHTYIPQVYDFVQEDGVVYTVMDYIEGESLDKLLKRNERAGQPVLVKWSCQLLEALCYLHSRGEHGILHGDIKPANIMLRPNGDICLIDFNIALALGEDGAVKVGFSRGYASPEHYGVDYNIQSEKNNDKKTKKEKKRGKGQNNVTGILNTDEKTELIPDQNNDYAAELSSRRSTTSMKNAVLLDVRSDIYSLGATLYHLISGKRPEQNARDVIPLDKDCCSPLVSKILQKAMNPDPALRYQTAEEMLEAFLSLYKNDPKTIRHKRRIMLVSALTGCIMLSGGICTFVGLKQMEKYQNALVLAENSANTLEKGNVSEAIDLALQSIPKGDGVLQAPMAPQSQKALTDALGVYLLQDGFLDMDSFSLPSEPFDMVTSPDGTKIAVVYAYEVCVIDVENKKTIVSLPVQKSALSDVIFLDDSKIIYAAEDGVSLYDLEQMQVVWTKDVATTLTLSGNKQVVAAIDRNSDVAFVYRTADGKKIAECILGEGHLSVPENDIFADARVNVFSLNWDGTFLAANSYKGDLVIYDIKNPMDSLILYEESDYEIFQGGFTGSLFAYSCQKSGESEFGIVDVEEAVYVGGFTSEKPMLLHVDEQGIYLANEKILEQIDMETFEEKELVYMEDADIISYVVGKDYILLAADDQSFSLYGASGNLVFKENKEAACDFLALLNGYAVVGNRNEPRLQIVKEVSYKDTVCGYYDAAYRHDEARISQDETTVMLFNYQGFRIYDRKGTLIKEVKLPENDKIYDQQYRKDDNSYLEVIWYDGTVRKYSAKDGGLLSEEKREAPSKDLEEEFYTDKYRIVSSLHEAPEVYDLKSDKRIAVLEKDSYLTYVTQAGEQLITEYVDAEGMRYGILLDKDLQTIAYLPYLCDVSNGKLVFDYGNGDLRQSPLYSIEELISLGENSISSL